MGASTSSHCDAHADVTIFILGVSATPKAQIPATRRLEGNPRKNVQNLRILHVFPRRTERNLNDRIALLETRHHTKHRTRIIDKAQFRVFRFIRGCNSECYKNVQNLITTVGPRFFFATPNRHQASGRSYSGVKP